MASLHGFKSCLDLTQMLATSMRSCRCAPHPFIRACAQSIGCHSQSESLTLIFAICVSLARSDMDRKTHWGQELFLFGTEQPVSPDSRITGVIEFGYHQVYKYVATMYMCVMLSHSLGDCCALSRVRSLALGHSDAMWQWTLRFERAQRNTFKRDSQCSCSVAFPRRKSYACAGLLVLNKRKLEDTDIVGAVTVLDPKVVQRGSGYVEQELHSTWEPQ